MVPGQGSPWSAQSRDEYTDHKPTVHPIIEYKYVLLGIA